MKVLNRPMFRMGGPIKEGIMDGIKEPRRGYQAAGFVVPNDDFSTMQTNKLLSNFNNVNAANAFANIFKPDDRYVNEVSLVPASKKIEPPKENIFAVDQIGSDVLDSDFATTIRDPESGKIVIQPPQGLDAVTKAKIKANLGIIPRSEYQNILKAEQNKGKGRVFEGEEALIVGDPRELEKDTPIDKVIADKGKIDMDNEPQTKTKKQKVNEILDSLGYKRAQKNALYDAMIKAGQRISRTGLGADNLVSDVIAETSQSYDKPEKLREAAELMQTQQDLKLEQIEASKTDKNKQDLDFWTKTLGSKDAAVRYLTKDSQSSTEAYLAAKKATGSGIDGVKAGIEWMIRAGEIKPEENMGEINKKKYDNVSEFVKSDEFKSKGPGVYQLEGIVARIGADGSVDIVKSFGTISEKTSSWFGFGS